MLAKVGDVSEDKVRVTKLDIDNYGSVIPLREVELKLPDDDDSVIQALKSAPYAAIFTQDDEDRDGSTIILVRGITENELNEEKKKTVDKVNKAKF